MGHPRFPIQSVTLATAVVTIHSRVYFQSASQPWASPHLWPSVSGCLGQTQRNSLIKSSDNQKISTVSRLGLAAWCLPVYSLLARGWLWGWHFSSKPDVVAHPSQLSGRQGRRKLKAAGATQWDSVFKESPLRWLEARYSCSGLCSVGSQSLRSTAIKGRHDQLISALGRSVWLLTDCCVLLHGR